MSEFCGTTMPSMRTTLTLDDDVARRLKELTREQGGSFKSTVNEVLRRGLTTGEKPLAARKPFEVQSARRGFRAGIDPLKLNQLSDELESEGFLEQDHDLGRGS